MKKGIIGLLNNPATSLNHHSTGMVNIVKSLFNAEVLTEKDDWDKFDELIIYHGVNFKKGVFNVIGGINDSVLQRCEKLYNYKNKIYSLDGFQLNEFSIKRKINLYNNYNDIDSIDLPMRKNLVIGDSHSLSVWPGDSYTICRLDGKTLFGFLKDPYKYVDFSMFDNIIFYFGNIDIRFHLASKENPTKSTIELINKYIDFAKNYNSTIVNLLPIENESRILPKSGQYKGYNFIGSWSERNNLKNLANNLINTSGLKTLKWPSFIVNDKKELDFLYMEPGKSVHLRPKFYMSELNKQLTLF